MTAPKMGPWGMVAFLALVLGGGCNGSTKPSDDVRPLEESERDAYGLTKEQAAMTVLVVGTRALRLDTFAGLLGRRPRQRGLPPETQRREKFLDDQLRLELLSVEAERAGIRDSVPVKRLEENSLVQRMVEDQVAKVPAVTNAEVHAYYDSHAERFVVPPRVIAMHILVKRREQARDLIAELQSGAEPAAFMELARQHSLDTYTAHRGGRLGIVSLPKEGEDDAAKSATDVVTSATAAPKPPEELIRAAFSTPERMGLHPEPIHSAAGYHVLWVLKRVPQQVLQFSQVQRELTEEITQLRNQATVDTLAESLQQQADVQRDLDALAKAF